jgi:maltodextrin utilization protein YvdJ
MFYLKAFINSLYNLSWLKAQKNNGKQAANYIVLFIILLSAVYAGYFSYIIPNTLRSFSNEVFEQVPDFKAEFNEGALHVDNVDQPYIFEGEDDSATFKVVLDTISTSTLNIEDFVDEDDAYTILITSEKMIVQDNSASKTTIQSFVDAENMSFTKQDVQTVVDSFLNNTLLIFVLLLIFWFVVFAFGRVVYLLFLSLLVYLIAKFFKSGEWKFSQVYTVGLFALTLPSLIVILLGLLDARAPYLFSIITLGIMLGAVFIGSDSVESETPQVQDHTNQ